jgi:hypothetical protein
VATRLGSLRDRFVFIGGSTIGLLLSDPGSPRPRPTKDVDLIVQVDGRAEFSVTISEQLRALGFGEMSEPGAPICAWKVDGYRVDIMPTDPGILGFANRWYDYAVASSENHVIDGLSIRVISSVALIATKIEAFTDRGRGDFFGSHDLEDIVAIVDGRPELLDELGRAEPGIARFISRTFSGWLKTTKFLDSLEGHVLEVGREKLVHERLQALADV